jgi:hypothetical protein
MEKERKKINRNETNCLSNQPGARDHIDPFFFYGYTMWWTYKTLVPGPYCPDTGQAHTTCSGLSVAFVDVVFS